MAQTPHLYIPSPWEATDLDLGDDQRHHLFRVLRLAPGAPVTYTDGVGTVGEGRLTELGVKRGGERSVRRHATVSLAVAPPSSRSRCRFLVEKLAELGVARLWWISTLRTEGRPPSDDKAKAWMMAALEQSRGAWAMEMGVVALPDLDPRRVVVADPEGESREIPPDAVLLVGPEGGFDDGEIPPGWPRVSLGPNILRVETAAVVASVRAMVHQGH
jgi:16S rRNA (uracil1498-N3)-methyltransferase